MIIDIDKNFHVMKFEPITRIS